MIVEDGAERIAGAPLIVVRAALFVAASCWAAPFAVLHHHAGTFAASGYALATGERPGAIAAASPLISAMIGWGLACAGFAVSLFAARGRMAFLATYGFAVATFGSSAAIWEELFHRGEVEAVDGFEMDWGLWLFGGAGLAAVLAGAMTIRNVFAAPRDG